MVAPAGTTRTVDVLVVGAGPAGVAAGMRAHRRGADTLVIDRAEFPRDKTCGDGLTTAALRMLEGLGLDVRRVPGTVAVESTVLVGPEGRTIELPISSKGTCVAVTRRHELDVALVELARSQRVTVEEGTALEALQPCADGVLAELSGGATIRARWIIGADGHYSTVRRLAAPASGADLGTWHAVRRYYRGVDDRRLWVLFERDLLPGYAWVFPLADGRANVGFGVLRDGARRGKQLAVLPSTSGNARACRGSSGPVPNPKARHGPGRSRLATGKTRSPTVGSSSWVTPRASSTR